MADKKKSGEGGQGKSRRWRIGIWQVVGIGLIVVAACWQFGTKRVPYEGFVQPRQINARFVDERNNGIAGVVVERQVEASPAGPMQVWHHWAGPTDSAGVCTFAIGGRPASETEMRYFWGLYKKEHRDHPVVEYRFATAGRVVGMVREEQFLVLPEAGRVDPNNTTFLDPLPEEMLANTDGKVVVCSMTVTIKGLNNEPNAPKAKDPNE